MEQLRLTLKLLRKHQLYARLSNYDFYEDGIHYLGHIISDKGIYVDPEKIEAIMSRPAPRNMIYVSSFLRLAGYCRKFIEGYYVGRMT